MHQGNWTCSGCGGAITQLPFEPRRTDGLLCRECHSKQKGGGSSAPRSQDGERPKIAGDWKCATCGTGITSLPFTPRDTSNLKCIDCFKKSKGH
jgi:CxxC-x17-CxxC domain-containing protein